MQITTIPCLTDNYAYIISDNKYKKTLRQGLNNLDKWFYKSNKNYRKKK